MKTVGKTLIFLVVCLTMSSCSGERPYDNEQLMTVGTVSLISILFLVLAVYSNLLRDEISNLEAFHTSARQLQQTHKWLVVDKNAPFSLTKVQFGVWTVIISSSYIYLSLVKGDCAMQPINKTALVLMGIFAGTAVASTLMDKAEINDNRDRHQNAPSQGFFADILSDDNGISLHRFQNVAWTIIAMLVYLYKVSLISKGCELPELSDTLLALTGISSATYLVLKSKENDPPVQEVQQANAAAALNNPVSTATVFNNSPNPVTDPGVPVAST